MDSNGVVAVCTEGVAASDESNVSVTSTDDPHRLHQAPKLCVVVGLNSNRPSWSKVLLKLLVEVLPELVLVPSVCVTARIAAPITLVVEFSSTRIVVLVVNYVSRACSSCCARRFAVITASYDRARRGRITIIVGRVRTRRVVDEIAIRGAPDSLKQA